MIRGCNFLVVLLLLFAAGCASDALKQPTAGRTRSHAIGTPEFDLNIVEDADTLSSWIEVEIRIPHSALIYTRADDRFRAMYEIRTRIIPDDQSISPLDEISSDSILSREDHGDAGEQIASRRFALPAGEYLVEVTLEDLNTNGTAVRRQKASVFSIADGCARFSRLRLFRTRGGIRSPYLPFHIPEGADTLEAVVKLYHPDSVGDSVVTACLLKYRADTTIATPPYFFGPTDWSLSYRGVDFAKPETVWTKHLPFPAESTATLSIPGLLPPRGLYELVFEATGLPCTGRAEPFSFRHAAYLSVLESGFPRPTSIPQMIDPLAYIATPDELRELRGAATPKEQRDRFEKFWLNLAGSPQAARNLIKEFYTRVLDANFLYTSYKEGWKTDRGMIHIVAGPPGYVKKEYQREIWEYETGYQFLFQWAKPFRPNEPFETYVLYRDVGYERYWEKAIDRWRRGQVY